MDLTAVLHIRLIELWLAKLLYETIVAGTVNVCHCKTKLHVRLLNDLGEGHSLVLLFEKRIQERGVVETSQTNAQKEQNARQA